MPISYRETAQIAENMARLLAAGVPMDRLFATVLRYNRSRRAKRFPWVARCEDKNLRFRCR